VRKIRISAGGVEQDAELNDTQTASQLWEALPLEAAGSRWGDEIYFAIPLRAGTERGQEVVEPGDLAYWEPGSAFCIFWGPTPASQGDECRPYSAVTVFGRLVGDPKAFAAVSSGATVRVERAPTSTGP
jgi:hypothetical protein